MTENAYETVARMANNISEMCHNYSKNQDRLAIANNIKYMADTLLMYEIQLAQEIAKYTGEV